MRSVVRDASVEVPDPGMAAIESLVARLART
jgi:hypothetical protein